LSYDNQNLYSGGEDGIVAIFDVKDRYQGAEKTNPNF
jgi:hypothetical protein